jgi:hypothetical protein
VKYGKPITDEIAKMLAEGSNRTDACVLAGINYDTFCDWMKKKPEFSEAIKKAEVICKNRNIKIVQRAAINTWQAAAWWLERKHSDEFALKNKTDLTVFNPEPVQFVPAAPRKRGQDHEKGRGK